MIVEQYVHTLIPNDAQFAPRPEQITRFLDGLSTLGAAPLNPELLVLRPSGRVRSFTDPLTGETEFLAAYDDRIALKSTADLASSIGTLQQYFVALEGQGPPTLPPFRLYFNDAPFAASYGFVVRCCLQAEPVSMSDLGEEQTVGEAPFFGDPCGTQNTAGLFRHPVTGGLIEVSNASCARFWVELEFGKWLLPKIDDSLNILDPVIAALADESFGLGFAQGFHHF